MIKTTSDLSTYEFVTQEDRSAHRIKVSIPGYLRPVGGKRLVTTTRNISLSGFSAIAMTRLVPGARCWLSLPGMPPLEAEVVWWEGGVVGCAFSQIFDATEFERLLLGWIDPSPRYLGDG
jgi:hypothetical protein